MLSTNERKLVLQWNRKGKTQQEIAELLGCHQSSVSRLLEKYRRRKTVANLPRSGRPTKLTKRTVSKLQDTLAQMMHEENEKYCAISTKQVARVIEQEAGKPYTMRHIRRLLHKMGFSLITPRPQHIKHDPEKVDKFREDFKKKFRTSMWTTKSSLSTKQASN